MKDQRELIKTLVEDKAATQKKFDRVLKTLERLPGSDETPRPSSPPITVNNSIVQANFFAGVASSESSQREAPELSINPVWSLPSTLAHRKEEIEHHCQLIKNLVKEISAVQYKIDHGLRDRMHRGVLAVHWEEWSPLRKLYGNETLINVFAPHSEVVGLLAASSIMDYGFPSEISLRGAADLFYSIIGSFLDYQT